MGRVGTGKGSPIGVKFVGDEAAASHLRYKVLGARYEVQANKDRRRHISLIKEKPRQLSGS